MRPPPVTLRSMSLRPGDLSAIRRRAQRTLQVSAIHVRGARSRPYRIRLWLPLTPLFWALSPFALLLAPLITLAPPLRGMNPFAAAVALGHVLVSLGGTDVDVDTPGARVRLRIL